MGITLLIVGANTEERNKKVRKVLTEIFGEVSKFNPNLVKLTGNIGIDQVRKFKANLSQKPYSGTVQVGLIEIDDITLQAQNALLKLIEEPAISTQIIVTVNRSDKLLPTIISRARIIFTSDDQGVNLISDKSLRYAKIISRNSLAEKFTIASQLQTNNAVDWCGEQIILWHQVFLAQLGVTPANKSEIFEFAQKQDLKKTFKFLRSLVKTLNLLKLNVNQQLLLENLFLSLP